MSQTSMSLAEIAIQSGFNDQAAFTRTFHQLVGESPDDGDAITRRCIHASSPFRPLSSWLCVRFLHAINDKFSKVPPRTIRHSTLVVNGVHDEMIPVVNSYWLAENEPGG